MSTNMLEQARQNPFDKLRDCLVGCLHRVLNLSEIFAVNRPLHLDWIAPYLKALVSDALLGLDKSNICFCVNFELHRLPVDV